MNKFINTLLLFLLFPTLMLAIYVGLDLPISALKVTGSELPYRHELFLGLGLLLFVLNLRRSIRRWMGVQIVSKKERFKWNMAVSSDRVKRVNTYLALEVAVMTFVGIALLVLTTQAWLPAAAFLFGAVDNLVFMILSKKGNRYRVGLSSKALIVADREVTVLYFTGLRKVSLQQQSIYFDYIKGLQLSFPSDCIPEEEKTQFYALLEAQLDPDKVYFSRKS